MAMNNYDIMTPQVIDKILEDSPSGSTGKREIERIKKIRGNYDYYNGKQELDDDGNYIYSTDKKKPNDLDYDPTKYWTNYFKAFIKRKSRWQMAGDHGIDVEPASDNDKDVKLAQDTERLLHQLWNDNDMNAKKMQIARDRLIAGSIAVKLAFNKRTGRVHWIWHKATEVFPIYSRDGFDELIGCDIIIPREDSDDPEKTEYVRQSFRLEEDYSDCWFSEIVYDEKLEIKTVLTKKTYLGFDFVPIVIFNVDALKTETTHFDDLEDMKILTRILNNMMEDANDSLKFEMFGMTVVKNAEIPESEDLKIAPGALLKINASHNSSHPADVETVENGFRWKEAYKDQYNRVKSALHELSGLPMIVPQELNFGGMNDRALQVLYQDIIQETQEHWLLWNIHFIELFSKTIGYLQARTISNNFAYDKSIVSKIDKDNLNAQMKFILPLPDDRENLVDLVTKEIDAGLESHKNGMKRLGVKNPEDKEQEIYEENMERINMNDPYNERQVLSNNKEEELLGAVEKELDIESDDIENNA
ncbi:phage portal protein [Staphylococcus felis]|uniref:Phage portal protein n=1 Tax=Staphylococcus felis TaxID=46127 RepID=A0ABS0QLM7_9STAP|nr:phage portal protein [Staphylococcus felis]MBH9580120.1 phage portal protein [Staphylococcus felis]REI09529.1 hypothetical protein DOS69_01975 [Staphylococcus felis]REI33595.1 hypothetical protein DOS82_05710 [Staphylococcus felis]